MRSPSFRFPLSLAPLACGLFLLLVPAVATHSGDSPASSSNALPTGTTIVVNNCNDSGPGSLRAAVARAIGDETIDMRGLNCRRITLTSGAIVTSQINLTIVGGGDMTIDANRTSQVFRHENSGTLRLRGMTITRGFKQSDSLGAPLGGCIYSDGNLELRYVRVHDCQACGRRGSYARGGGIFVNYRAMVYDSKIVNNRATGPSASGGGLYADGGALVRRTRISRNHAQYEGGGLFAHSGLDARYTSFLDNTGGALMVFGKSVIGNSTISGNRNINSYFGGIVNMNAAGASVFDTEPLIVNTTISGNRSSYYTVFMRGVPPGAIINSTIAFNEHTGGSDGSACADYAAVFLNGGWEGPALLDSTIAANNTCAGNPYYDFGKYESDTELELVGANNLVTSSIRLPLPPDTISVEPRLAPLASNGGPTRTHALLDDSPAIDMGNNAAGLAYDQRGLGFQRVKGPQADIGAYER